MSGKKPSGSQNRKRKAQELEENQKRAENFKKFFILSTSKTSDFDASSVSKIQKMFFQESFFEH